jgi:hypothetical protein
MKNFGILLMSACAALFAVGCNNPQGQEAKEKAKEVGKELLNTGEKALEAAKSGAESVIEEGKDAAKSASDATSKALEGNKSGEPK